MGTGRQAQGWQDREPEAGQGQVQEQQTGGEAMGCQACWLLYGKQMRLFHLRKSAPPELTGLEGRD